MRNALLDRQRRFREAPGLVAEGRDLYWWHHLVSGDPNTVHYAGISVRGRTLSEDEVPVSLYEQHVVEWPNEDPALAIAAAGLADDDGPDGDWEGEDD